MNSLPENREIKLRQGIHHDGCFDYVVELELACLTFISNANKGLTIRVVYLRTYRIEMIQTLRVVGSIIFLFT